MDNLLVGTALLIKRRVVEDIGYLDEHYFAYVEDFEYCIRAKHSGHESVVMPSARVYHKDAEWKVKRKKPMVVFLRTRNTYFFWMGILNGRRRKFDYALHYLADRISFFSELRREGHFEAADACLDGVWAALLGIGGPRDNNVKVPRILVGILCGSVFLQACSGEHRTPCSRRSTGYGIRKRGKWDEDLISFICFF
jgi:hypothetical protein